MDSYVDHAFSRRQQLAVLATLCCTVLLIAVDATVLNLAVPQITADLEPTSQQTLWILDAYSLVLAGLLVAAGSLSDRLGRKRVLLVGCAAFGMASAFGAFAPTAELLILARVLMGIAGAFIMPSTLALIRGAFPDAHERRMAIGAWSAMAAAGAAAGPIIGGVLLERFWWGSVLLINVPIMAIVLVLGAWVLREERDPNPHPWDLPSVALSCVGIMGTAYAIKRVAEHGVEPATAVLAALAGATVTAFVVRQLRIPGPLIDVRLFKIPSFSVAVTANFLSMVALSGLLLTLSQLFQLVDAYSPIEAGIRLAPMTLGAIAGSVSAAFLLKRFGLRSVLASGVALAALGMVAFGYAAGGSYPPVALALVAIGAGVGTALAATNDAILASAPAHKAGAASAVSETAYELGTGFGIAVLGSVTVALYRNGLPATAPEAARESIALAISYAQERGLTDLAQQAQAAYLDALQSASLIAAGVLAVLSVSVAVLLRPARSRVARDAHGGVE